MIDSAETLAAFQNDESGQVLQEFLRYNPKRKKMSYLERKITWTINKAERVCGDCGEMFS